MRLLVVYPLPVECFIPVWFAFLLTKPDLIPVHYVSVNYLS
jgi:hypothetical protein